ncbi:unnamed protein product [Didymodactylos carnosus]|uniref:Uncharacterized protein n=1 Tax=Didymodactylos carnosus TaxID=1234261 RepID=A0A814KG04_9BILA|nr:unnamed protein product [Didymodactylos carnosus]CAF1051992.1 unnamed protein product [Didymodactylos carnosus]CAF3766155.1 unnamed protein product [Didymodactylos carnosus]CAF3821396.1 unnamed protein product [Didymodactylos carnosus]
MNSSEPTKRIKRNHTVRKLSLYFKDDEILFEQVYKSISRMSQLQSLLLKRYPTTDSQWLIVSKWQELLEVNLKMTLKILNVSVHFDNYLGFLDAVQLQKVFETINIGGKWNIKVQKYNKFIYFELKNLPSVSDSMKKS